MPVALGLLASPSKVPGGPFALGSEGLLGETGSLIRLCPHRVTFVQVCTVVLQSRCDARRIPLVSIIFQGGATPKDCAVESTYAKKFQRGRHSQRLRM